jgi:hypothetical protein
MDAKRLKKASFTVEAALIMSLVLTVIFGSIRLGLLLHDEAVLDGIVIQEMEKGEMAARHLGDMESGRPDYESLLSKADNTENIKTQKEWLRTELRGSFLMKKEDELSVSFSGNILEKTIEVSGNKGKRVLTLFYPAEYKRRFGK